MFEEYTSRILVCVCERERGFGVFEEYTSRILVCVCVREGGRVGGV